jgi:hypothetical protein
MKELPILYNTDMVLAKLDGRKTVTRRPAKNIPDFQHFGRNIYDWPLSGRPAFVNGRWECEIQTDVDDNCKHYFNCPYKPGDIIYVRRRGV